MPETAAFDGPPIAKAAATVSASALALHLDCTRTYIAKLEAEGVLQRAPDGGGFPLDASRVAYLRFLRCERRQSPRGEADAELTKAKIELLQLRLAERAGQLVRLDEFNTMLEQTSGAFLTALGELPAMIGGRDMPLRRKVEGAVRHLRKRLAEKFSDQAGEFERAMAATVRKAQDADA